MMKSIASRLMVACSLLCGTAAICAAQTYTPPPPPLTTLPPCPADKDAKKRAKRKDCDPTVYPSETVEAKGKKDSDASTPAAQTGQPAAATSAAQANPYPGDSTAEVPSSPAVSKTTGDAPAAQANPYPGDNGKALSGQDVPHDPAAERRAAETPAGKSNPFPSGTTPDMPKDTTEPAAQPNSTPSGAASGASSSNPSDSSSSSSSSDDPHASDSGENTRNRAKNPDDDDEDKPKLTDKGSEGKRSKKVVKPQTDEDRVDKDLSVAKFYGQSGNYTGAYMRAKDAVKTEPEYPEGHFALGEAAKRLNKKDEAVAEFQKYLKLAPDGREAKAAEKALEDLK